MSEAWLHEASTIVRIVHETGLRTGTFLGLGRFGDPAALQHWGAFVARYDPMVGIAPVARPTPVPGTAGALVFADLTDVSGRTIRPDVAGAEERRAAAGGTWHLEMADHRLNGPAGPEVVLSYRWADPGAYRGMFGGQWFRLAVDPSAVMLPV